ncbi:hypothetical protein [Collimonas sp. OK307]|uniref:hypothetical protein n=1 Tax=Collimonas sp. OK307 TaxID=1801620 RepID=UPI0015878EDF|nr:hypothetical protein [Collimonas sp. OK307]
MIITSVIVVLVLVAAISITAISRTVWGNYAAAEQDGQTKQDSKAFHDGFQTFQGYQVRRLNPCIVHSARIGPIWKWLAGRPFGQAFAPVAGIGESRGMDFLGVPKMCPELMIRLHEPMGVPACIHCPPMRAFRRMSPVNLAVHICLLLFSYENNALKRNVLKQQFLQFSLQNPNA